MLAWICKQFERIVLGCAIQFWSWSHRPPVEQGLLESLHYLTSGFFLIPHSSTGWSSYFFIFFFPSWFCCVHPSLLPGGSKRVITQVWKHWEKTRTDSLVPIPIPKTALLRVILPLWASNMTACSFSFVWHQVSASISVWYCLWGSLRITILWLIFFSFFHRNC